MRLIQQMGNKRGKILLQMEYSILEPGEGCCGDTWSLNFSNPDLKGTLYLESTSMDMLDLQLKYLDRTEVPTTDPLKLLMESANKLVAGAIELKQVISN